MLYFFFLRLESPLTMNITCYDYLNVGLKEAAWSSSILRGREFCYVGAHSPKNLKIYLSCFSEVIGLCWLVDLPVSKFLQGHYRLSQPWQELNLIQDTVTPASVFDNGFGNQCDMISLHCSLPIRLGLPRSHLIIFFLWKNPYEGTLCGITYFVSCLPLTFFAFFRGFIFNTLWRN